MFQAYRLEPLILKHYSTIIPLRIHRWDQVKQVEMAYGDIKPEGYTSNKNKPTDKSSDKSIMPPPVTDDKERNNNGSDSESLKGEAAAIKPSSSLSSKS